MGLHGAVVLVGQIDSDISEVGVFAPIVVTDHAVEIHGRRRTGVRHEISHFGNGAQERFEIANCSVGALKGGSFGHIHQQLQLVLVVEWQHFEGHHAHHHEHAAQSETEEDCPEQKPTIARRAEEG